MTSSTRNSASPAIAKSGLKKLFAFVVRMFRQTLSPVYFKELVQIALSRRTTITKGIFLFVLLGVSFLAITPMKSGDSNLGLVLFGTVSFAELVLALLITPIVTAGIVSGERQANTLDILFLTRLSNWNIVQDKGLSRITYMLYLCSLTFPFMFGAILFGGVETVQVLQTIFAIVSTVIFCGGVGVFASSFSRSYVTALVKSYVVIVLTLIMLPIIVGVVTGGRSPWAIVASSPFFAIMVSIQPGMTGPGGLAAAAWPVMLGGSVGFYLLAVLLSCLRLRRDRQKRKRQESTSPNRAFHWRDLLKLLQPARIYDFRTRNVGRFPIVWKNAGFAGHRLKSVLSNLWILLLVATSALIIYIAFQVESFDMFGEPYFYWILYGIFMPLSALFTIILGAESFTSDWSAKRMELLLASRISGKQFVYGTLFSLIRSCLMTWAIPLSLLAIGAIVTFGRSNFDNVEFVIPFTFVVVHMMFFLVLGMQISLWLKRAALSVAITMLIALVICFGPFLLSGVVGVIAMVLGAQNDNVLGPVIKMIVMLSPAFWGTVSCSSEVFEKMLSEDHGLGFVMAGVHLLLFTGFTIGGMIRLVIRFDRICGRQSGGRAGAGPKISKAEAERETELPKNAAFGSTPPPIPESARRPTEGTPSTDDNDDPGAKLPE